MSISTALFSIAAILLAAAICFIILGLIQKAKEPKAFFTSHAEIEKNIIEIIKQSKRSIAIAMYNLKNLNIADELINAKKGREVLVKVVVDAGMAQEERDRIAKGDKIAEHSALTRLRQNGIEPREIKSASQELDDEYMHHKFAIFDSEILTTGSYNWTYKKGGEGKTYDNIVLIYNPEVIRKYQDEFDRIWKK
ncbi:MAG: hypothetical protein A2W23_09005 [Planctomycetes bacterium RBG_16_43_13]|nr:MAG: hypothetical protein A2W23_09005 [Planctomycetes bacterium RBG_16_43_13]